MTTLDKFSPEEIAVGRAQFEQFQIEMAEGVIAMDAGWRRPRLAEEEHLLTSVLIEQGRKNFRQNRQRARQLREEQERLTQLALEATQPKESKRATFSSNNRVSIPMAASSK